MSQKIQSIREWSLRITVGVSVTTGTIYVFAKEIGTDEFIKGPIAGAIAVIIAWAVERWFPKSKRPGREQ